MAINVRTELFTCSTLPVQIGGGQKPYTVTLAPFGVGTHSINVTMGANDDTLAWVNTLPPTTNFLIAVSDRSVERDLYHRGTTDLPYGIARVNILPPKCSLLLGIRILPVPTKHAPSIRVVKPTTAITQVLRLPPPLPLIPRIIIIIITVPIME